jgi:ABC-type phosphate/phosphonate transport system ATPase subunit
MFEHFQKTDEFNELCLIWKELHSCTDVARRRLLVGRWSKFWLSYTKEQKARAAAALRMGGFLEPALARAVDVFGASIYRVNFTIAPTGDVVQ